MINLYRKAMDNLKNFAFNSDDLDSDTKYGVAPPNYMSTEPRFEERPETQDTRASKWNSSLAQNPQAGTELSGRPVDKLEVQYIYDGGIEPPSQFVENLGYYKQDPRVKRNDATVQVEGTGYPSTEQTGAESFFDKPQGPYDRDPTEVNTPVVRGTPRAYQGSQERYTNSPSQELGGSAIGPVESMYQTNDEMDDCDNDHDQEWIKLHPNAVSHTVGHDHPYKHKDRYTPVEFATSIGDRGVR